MLLDIATLGSKLFLFFIFLLISLTDVQWGRTLCKVKTMWFLHPSGTYKGFQGK